MVALSLHLFHRVSQAQLIPDLEGPLFPVEAPHQRLVDHLEVIGDLGHFRRGIQQNVLQGLSVKAVFLGVAIGHGGIFIAGLQGILHGGQFLGLQGGIGLLGGS